MKKVKKMYRPSLPFSTPLILLTPTYTTVQGVRKKTFTPIADSVLFYGTFKTYGGTERDVNGVYSIEDTANIETWYTPLITSGCRVVVANTNAEYEIIGEPENIDMRNQFMKFKVQRVKGGA